MLIYSTYINAKSSFTDLTLAIDGSTSCTGLALLSGNDLVFLTRCLRDKAKGESAVRYKIYLKQYLTEYILGAQGLSRIIYEEPCMDNRTAVKNLYMLASTVKEILIENEDTLRGREIEYIEVSNMRWKKFLLSPNKVPNRTEKAKTVIRERVYQLYPFLETLNPTQDEIDALGMGYTSINKPRLELVDRPLARPFKKHIEFIGTQKEQPVQEILSRLQTPIPRRLTAEGIKCIILERKCELDTQIRKDMSTDDVILVYRFSSKKQGNIVLKYQLSELVASSNYIYCIVWRERKTRSLNNVL